MSAESIDLLLLDVDGVLTDGSITIDETGAERKRFYVRDGSGIIAWRKQGRRVGILTGRPSRVTTIRARELGIALVSQGEAMGKVEAYEALRRRAGVEHAQVAYLGDDLADLPVLRRVGYPMAVADAVEEVRGAARYVTRTPGGRGAAREAIEHLLKAAGRWQSVLAEYDR